MLRLRAQNPLCAGVTRSRTRTSRFLWAWILLPCALLFCGLKGQDSIPVNHGQGETAEKNHLAGQEPGLGEVGEKKEEDNLKGKEPPLGEVIIKGDFIQTLVLERKDEEGTEPVILNFPEERTWIPVGAYSIKEIVLDGGERFGLLRGTCSQEVSVSQGKPVRLHVGGPLNHTVHAERRGSNLVMRYSLVGIGGEEYSFDIPQPEPRFAVYLREKKIASGSFEYG